MPIKGIDISNHQKGVNLKNYKNQGFEVCIIKATEGKSYISPTLDEQFKEAKAAGFKVGFYHFANNNSSPETQANFFKSIISKYDYDIQPCLDLETPVNNATDFITRFINTLGGKDKSYVYTGLSYYHENINTYGYNIWMAAYRKNAPSIHDNTIISWQYADDNGMDKSIWYSVPYVKKAEEKIDPVKEANKYLEEHHISVWRVQELLEMAGYKFNKIDGECGAKTTSYIADVQKRYGMHVDYCFGKKTLKAVTDLINKNFIK